MKFSLRTLFWIVVGVVIVAAGVMSLMPQPIPVDTDEVTRGPLRVTIDEDGKTRIKERYIVSSPVAGRSMRITLREGDPVIEGETVLVRIQPAKPTLLDARAEAEAEALLEARRAALERAKIALEQARTELNLAETQLGRLRELADKTSVAESELDTAQTDYQLKRDSFRAARFDEDIARFEVKMAEAALTYTSNDDADQQFLIESPITGCVLRVLQESATFLQPGMPLIEIGNPSDLEVEIDVLSTDAVKVTPGDSVILEHWGGEHPLRGTVRLIEPSAYTKISALGVEEQRVNVLVDFEEDQEMLDRLGDGFRVEARIVIWQQDDVLRVPTSALFRQPNGEWGVLVMTEENVARLQTVTIGQRNSRQAQVLDGLQENQTVIIHPSDNIESGTRVAKRQ